MVGKGSVADGGADPETPSELTGSAEGEIDMVVCRKNETEESRNRPRTAEGGRSRRAEPGGPVFLPRRKPSALVQAMMALPDELDRITAYDEQWYARRPRI